MVTNAFSGRPSALPLYFKTVDKDGEIACAPAFVLTNEEGESYTPGSPLPIQIGYAAAASTPVTGTANATSTSATFTPDLGRPIWVRLSGTWAGTVQMKRSTDGGATWNPVTYTDGSVKGVWTTNVNAAIQEETCAGAIYRLEITSYISGIIEYEVRQ